MSVVAVRIDPQAITIAADSIRVSGWTQDKRYGRKLESVNEMIIGACGLYRESNMMQLFLRNHTPVFPDAGSVLDLVAEFRKWMKSEYDLSVDVENQYILVFKGHVFKIDVGMTVDEIDDFHAIGAGADYALTALYLGHTAERAVEIACDLSIYCERPVQVMRIERTP